MNIGGLAIPLWLKMSLNDKVEDVRLNRSDLGLGLRTLFQFSHLLTLYGRSGNFLP